MTKLTSTMAEAGNASTLEWTRPDQVMQLHRIKVKKRALQARMNKTDISNIRCITTDSDQLNSSDSGPQRSSQKRKNPFVINEWCKKQKDATSAELEISNDNTLFELLHFDIQRPDQAIDSPRGSPLTFTNVLSQLESNERPTDTSAPKGERCLPIDWSLKTKMRFMSPKPFPWNGKLKTSEEASGTTGFVRCLNIGEKETTLDTSPNARFHQCCLVWQHPSLPWLELFPRSTGRVSDSLTNHATIANNQYTRNALHKEWCDSFRSLFHLLRARQCPYFYVCANTFTVLFRAAGICGLSETHALLTPTTRGFRQSLKQEEIEYSMPLRKDHKRRSDTVDTDSKTVDNDTSDTTADSRQDDHYEEEEDEAHDSWLQSLGIENSEIRKINYSQARMILEKESEVDNLKQSLVFVKGVEAQALFNFLINCKSAIAATGALAGVPPTLLAPTAFHGATLKPLKVRESVVRVDNDQYHSLELKGPLLPHVLFSLCHLMESSQLEQYSVSCAQLASTLSFSAAKHGAGQADITAEEESCGITKVPPNVFGQENLSDCGFSKELLKHFCNPDPTRIEIVESFQFLNGLYTWS